MSANRLPDDLVQRMYADYQRLGSMTAAAALHGRTGHTLWGLFRTRGLPTLPGISERVSATRKARRDADVMRMYARYQEGVSLAQVGREFGCSGGNVRDLFVIRGLAIRPLPEGRWSHHKPDGSFVALREPTEEELTEILASMKAMQLPQELKQVWRRWPMEKRGAFIARARAVVQPRIARPELPFSANVTPFDYATPEARALANQLNAGRTSQTKVVQIRFGSQGVIWNGMLWFWTGSLHARHQGYVRGPFIPGVGRPELHRAIWESANGRAVPAQHVIRHRDGNPNNLDPANLEHLPREQMLRENQAKALSRKAREQTARLLTRHQTTTTTDTHELLPVLTRKPHRPRAARPPR